MNIWFEAGNAEKQLCIQNCHFSRIVWNNLKFYANTKPYTK